MVELASGDVDGDIEQVTSGVPRGHLDTCGQQHPASDLSDLAGLVEDRDKLLRQDDSPGGMTPTQECLDADHGQVAEVVDRQVNQDVLPSGQRSAQVEFEICAPG